MCIRDRVVVDVDGDAPENLKPVAEPEEGEFITVLLVPLAGLAARLRAEMKARGYHVDARLYAYAAGLELADAVARSPAAARTTPVGALDFGAAAPARDSAVASYADESELYEL